MTAQNKRRSTLTAAKSRASERINAIGTVKIECAAGDRKRPRVSIVAYTGRPMRTRSTGLVVLDLAGMKVPAMLNLLSDHGATIQNVVGSAKPQVRDGQLVATGTLSAATEAGRLVMELVTDGVAMQASVGADILESQMLREGEKATVNGWPVKAGRGGLMIVTKSELREISLVPIGADANTHVAIAANRGRGSDEDEPGDAGERTPVEEIRAEAAAEVDRVRKIRIIFQREYDQRAAHRESCALRGGGGNPDYQSISEEELMNIESRAISEGWSVGKAELEVIKGSRPSGGSIIPWPSRQSASRAGSMPAVVEASLCLSAGLSEEFLGEQFEEATMNEALSARYRGYGLHGLMRFVQAAAGVIPPSHQVTNDFIRATFEADRSLRVNAGFSTISLPGILSNVASKILLESYQAVESTWQFFAGVESNPNFKPASRFRMTAVGKYEKVAGDGELKHITVGEDSYSSQVDTSGCMIAITRKDLINDDLDSFARLPRLLGRMGAIALEREVFTILLANAGGHFSTNNGNYLSGATTNLSIDSLSAAEELALTMKDKNGDAILTMPSVLVVPPALRSRAFVINTSTEVRDTAANQKSGTANPHKGRYDVRVAPYLATSFGLPGASDVAWYLLNKPNSDVYAIAVQFLNGNKAPVVESADTDFNTLGIQLRSYWDWGVALADPKGGIRVKGEE